MNNQSLHSFENVDALYNGNYLSSRALFQLYFNELPQIAYMSGIDGEKAYTALQEKYAAAIQYNYAYNWVRKRDQQLMYDRNQLVLSNGCVLELDEGYAELYYQQGQQHFVKELIQFLGKYKQRQRREPFEVNLIVRGSNGFELKAMEIKRTRLDIGLYYEDDFAMVDTRIRERLRKPKDKGIVLLHGLPGTGKTTYLRYLVGQIKKRVLFLSPAVAEQLMNPELIDLLIDYPDSVLIIEDAENIIMDRKLNQSSAVSNLLNISDGLLADFLNVQLICTFNSTLASVDQALMRKGRLIARYEFGKLSVAKAQQLAASLGLKQAITVPQTLAEITNPAAPDYQMERVEVQGFRRQVCQN